MRIFGLSLLYCGLGLISCYDDWVYKTIRDVEAKHEDIDPCGICRLLSDSFTEGLDYTAKNLNPEPNYENSEVRLTEIQEKVCLELQYGKNKCLRLAQQQEDEIENWWHNSRKEKTLLDHLCFTKLNLCCGPGKFGPNCEDCPGAPDNICNKNGKCNGDGSKSGNGTCICDEGAQGVECETCQLNYIRSERGNCQKCDQACKNGCFKLGPDGCNEGCSDGFEQDDNGMCQDIDECKENKDICAKGKLCVNSYGSHQCMECDEVCETCHDFGNNCIKCATGYVMEGDLCVPYEEARSTNTTEIIKYLLYVALTVMSCLLMKRRPLVASVLTILISVYIGLAEYAKLNSLESALHAFEELWF